MNFRINLSFSIKKTAQSMLSLYLLRSTAILVRLSTNP